MLPDISILVSTYERPRHLERVLESIRAQRGINGQMEVVVSDDGSRDETLEIVERFAATATFPVKFTSHQHDGFRLAQCRNEGVTASTAPYLLFLDGDCLIPPDHVRQHLQRRRSGVVNGSYCIKLTEKESAQVDITAVRKGTFTQLGNWNERASLLTLGLKSHFYSWISHRSKPRLFGGNIGISRSDYERVNGYDERYRGWGCEDDDLGVRLRMAGIRVETLLPWTQTWHLWHPPTASKPQNWDEGNNVQMIRQKMRLSRCLDGLKKRNRNDIAICIGGNELLGDQLRSGAQGKRLVLESAEVEILACPTSSRFRNTADCNVAIASQGTTEDCSRDLIQSADVIIAQTRPPGFTGHFVEFENTAASLNTVLDIFQPAISDATISPERQFGSDGKPAAAA